jgi:hypothetical protein
MQCQHLRSLEPEVTLDPFCVSSFMDHRDELNAITHFPPREKGASQIRKGQRLPLDGEYVTCPLLVCRGASIYSVKMPLSISVVGADACS